VALCSRKRQPRERGFRKGISGLLGWRDLSLVVYSFFVFSQHGAKATVVMISP